MFHYILLTTSTLIIFFLLWRIWKKTGELAFIIGIALIYYWSLAGSWLLVYDQLNGAKGEEWGLHYYYLFEKLFPVRIDSTYLAVIGMYSMFIIILQLTILYFAKPRTERSELPSAIHIHHGRLIVMCILAAIAGLMLVYREILIAVKFDQSVYTITRSQPGKFYTLHQLMNEIAIAPLYLGLFTFLSGNKSRYLTGSHSRWYLFAYVLGIFMVEAYLMFLGNKREIMFAGILGLVFYSANVGNRMRPGSLILFGLITVIPLLFNDVLRGFSPKGLLSFFDTSDLTWDPGRSAGAEFSIADAASSLLFSNEMFCSNFSMYGVLVYDVPFTWGSSIISLFASIVPKIFWASRPADVYTYYAASVHAVAGQGYTLHHATAWYLNFGLAGVIAGAVALGGLWSWFYNRLMKINITRRKFLAVMFILAVAGVTAQMPAVIRGGPEAYKVVLIEGILLPALVIFIASVPLFKKDKR